MTETKALMKIIELMISGYEYAFEKDHITFHGQEEIELEIIDPSGKKTEKEIIFEFETKNLRGKLAGLKKRIKI